MDGIPGGREIRQHLDEVSICPGVGGGMMVYIDSNITVFGRHCEVEADG